MVTFGCFKSITEQIVQPTMGIISREKSIFLRVVVIWFIFVENLAILPTVEKDGVLRIVGAQR